MQLGMIGLGKMGGNMAARLRDKGHDVVGFDFNPDVRDVGSVAELVERLSAPRIVWLMVPAGEPTRSSIRELGALLEEGDLVIEGGNSHYQDDRRHAEELSRRGIEYLDAGVSGGVWGRENGYGIMVGGSPENVARAKPLFDALTPDGGGGFVHAGAVGAGHFVKMVHNGIEYGMMQAFAEGYELMAASGIVEDVPGTLASWREGTVVRSWLLDLLVRALEEDPGLDRLRGYAEDSGEGRWTVQAAVDHAVPAPVITAALYARFASRQEDSPAMKVIAALRNQFGGHAVTKAAE
ncbi:decarboxylating 6-phosphogluconate dehydrogenase [Thermobifida alba]|uniref:Decarboxylating 6-phosphogluconate dehydrogenase n=1 Tax=Thermobifida alba TaxID=53522 RepID=A0ABY4L8N7_THEAE|nr:decarboxylating 6-phosphogluconate dehydrogenase [Thermobifida alba]UPT22457.1 decarboxylating 6-phosphogluconate dehydrogenase [Thermobifida alba]